MSKINIFIHLLMSVLLLICALLLVWKEDLIRKTYIKEKASQLSAYDWVGQIITKLTPYLQHFVSWRYINLIERKAAFNGISLSGIKLYFSQLGFSFLVAVFGVYQNFHLIGWMLIWAITTALCFLLPLFYFNQLASKRKQGFLDAFSFLLDLLALNLGAGMSLNQSLKIANAHSESIFLQGNIQQLIHALEQGVAVERAWRDFAQRCDQEDVNTFVFAVLQAHRQGLALQRVLRQQARQIKAVIYTTAEKKALALPTKLIFPIMFFIFPITFIVIAFPLAYGMLAQSF
ncbi:MAG TPA: type II secretion system F family protein [Paenalcaligenes sp.]|nr:type II secretion system F family protein [Paenalcaligenes sp.]